MSCIFRLFRRDPPIVILYQPINTVQIMVMVLQILMQYPMEMNLVKVKKVKMVRLVL